ncbi:2-dehydro-3-deoxygalactonokinase [Parapedobacter sp. 2B3]|uniref:2-dehydro-3-deoxygalactonokinase n=1 Tax=Parapedobacter sp. 2B3 TaxID=3342381 RepID=UPI0035B64B29
MSKYLVSCDWGTSSLRIHLLDSESRNIIDSDHSGQGCAVFYETWIETACGHPPAGSRDGYYLGYLQSKWKPLCARNHVNPENVPVVISGMASSNIGIMELPYAITPFAIDGTEAVVHEIPSNQTSNIILLISGVQHGDEVMRGEETQLVGIHDTLVRLDNSRGVKVILPGTHSKHVIVNRRRVTDFSTYITGELFAILSNNGLFKDAVEKCAITREADGRLWDAFDAGISVARDADISTALFRIRTNRIFDRYDKQENYQYLSGMLIAYELGNLLSDRHQPIVLCAGTNLCRPYVRAIDHLGLGCRVHLVDPYEADMAAIHGQLRIANHCINKI